MAHYRPEACTGQIQKRNLNLTNMLM